MSIGNYRKFIAALVGFAAVLLSPAGLGVLPDESLLVGQEALVQAILAILGAAGVYAVPNSED